MTSKKNVLAISGSTRKSSSNLNLIKAIETIATDIFSITLFDSLLEIPPFNPDEDTDAPPAAITRFRKQLKEADGILICTPEYAMGIPGTLKNAIDWTVSSMEFSNKPVALITASSVGQKGHTALLETLKIIEARMLDSTQLLIPFIKTKVSADCKITDESTLQEVQKLVASFSLLMNEA
ncbi:MAG TPA: NADPH-dependent FMN reductase [Chitinophagaceae bacterium]